MSRQRSGTPRQFNQPRPSEKGVQANSHQESRHHEKFEPLPKPTGQPPYHLDLSNVLPADQITTIQNSGRILMHSEGDTGGVKGPQSQQIVAMAMEEEFNDPDRSMRPSCFY